MTVPDDAIAPVAASIAWTPRRVAVHCSGAQPASTMAVASAAGASTAAFHPLQTIADIESGLANLPGSSVGIEAEESVFPTLADMATAIGANPIRIRASDRAIYHLGSAIVSNLTVALTALAAELWGSIGVNRADALQALQPLLAGTVRNIQTLGIPAALTGPVVRGDVGTVERHLEALSVRPDARAAYCVLSAILVRLALEQGSISAAQASALEEVLARYDRH